MDDTSERLFRMSARALTDAELIALLIDGQDLSDSDLKALARTPAEDWLDDSRVTPSQAARLLAAFELGRRALLMPAVRGPLRSPSAIFELMRPVLANLSHEEVHVLCLDPANHLLRQRRVATGSTTWCDVDPREVFAAAVAARAASVVLVHNHPSGDPTPSAHDVALTRRLQVAGVALCIRVVDHVVVGDGRYVSMLEQGLIAGVGAEVSAPSAMGA